MTDNELRIIYLVVGFMIVSNVGTIITVIISAMKLAAKFGRMEHQIETNQKDINNAWSEIRAIKIKDKTH